MTQRPGISHHFPLTTFAAEAVKSGLPRDPKEQREGEADHETRPGAVEFCHDLQTQQIFQLGVSENGAPSSGMAIFFPGDDSPECHGQKKSSAPGSAKGQATHDHQADHGCRQHHLTLPRPGVPWDHLGLLNWEKMTCPLVMTFTVRHGKSPLIGKPSIEIISMGHLSHGYVK